jgi:hypothetical protein
VRTFALTDFVEARAARAAVRDARALIYCSMTSALLWPRPGAIWLDSLAAENRPGRHGMWQRVVERRRLAQSPLVLLMNPRPGTRQDHCVVRVPVEPSALRSGTRDLAAITYAGDPEKRRLGLVLDAWRRARRPGEMLLVAGHAGPGEEGVEFAGKLAPADYRAMLRRARAFLAAPKREDYGIAPLEALADGCLLVSTPSPGPYPALALARELDPRLVDDDLARAIRVALDDPVAGYAERAAQLLAPFGRAAVDRTVADDVLPRLLPGFRPA